MSQNIEDIISRQKACIEAGESDKEALVEYIRAFVEAKRGNQRLLATESGVPESNISNIVHGTGTPTSMERIVQIAEKVKNLT